MNLDKSSSYEGKLEFYMRIFNGALNAYHYPKDPEKVNFNVISGNIFKKFESSSYKEDVIKKLKDRLPKKQSSKIMEIMEPSILFDCDFFDKQICKLLSAKKSQINIKSLKLIGRNGYKSTYQIDAEICSEAISAIKGDFSLERLYFAFVGASAEEKELILEYLNSLRFDSIKNINYKQLINSNDKETLDILGLTNEFEKRSKDVLDEASKNSVIISMFNMDNPLFEIETPINNGYVDEMKIKKQEKKKNRKQEIKKVAENISKWFEDIDE